MITAISWTFGIIGLLLVGAFLLTKRYSKAAWVFAVALGLVLIVRGVFASTPPHSLCPPGGSSFTRYCSSDGRCYMYIE